MGQLIDETVNGERVEDVADRAQPALTHVVFRRAILSANVGHVEQHIGQAHAGFEVGAVIRPGGKGGKDRRERAAEEPRLNLAGSSDPGFTLFKMGRTPYSEFSATDLLS